MLLSSEPSCSNVYLYDFHRKITQVNQRFGICATLSFKDEVPQRSTNASTFWSVESEYDPTTSTALSIAQKFLRDLENLRFLKVSFFTFINFLLEFLFCTKDWIFNKNKKRAKSSLVQLFSTVIQGGKYWTGYIYSVVQTADTTTGSFLHFVIRILA